MQHPNQLALEVAYGKAMIKAIALSFTAFYFISVQVLIF